MAGNSTKHARERKKERKLRRDDRKYGKPERQKSLTALHKKTKKRLSHEKNQVVPFLSSEPFVNTPYIGTGLYIDSERFIELRRRYEEWRSLDDATRAYILDSMIVRVVSGFLGQRDERILFGFTRESHEDAYERELFVPEIIFEDAASTDSEFSIRSGPVIREITDDGDSNADQTGKKKLGNWKRFRKFVRRIFCCGGSKTKE